MSAPWPHGPGPSSPGGPTGPGRADTHPDVPPPGTPPPSGPPPGPHGPTPTGPGRAAELRAEELLATLGDTEDAVAEHLRTLGIRGVPREGKKCPIYNFLCANGVPVYRVDSSYIDFDDGWLDSPTAVCDFIDAFDGGAFPELEAVS